MGVINATRQNNALYKRFFFDFEFVKIIHYKYYTLFFLNFQGGEKEKHCFLLRF